MFELRKDILTGEWVTISTSRSNRPMENLECKQNSFEFPDHDPGCPFCPGNEENTPPETVGIRDRGLPNDSSWRIRIVPNKYPAVMGDAPEIPSLAPNFFGMPGRGRHEVIIETRKHNLSFGDYSDRHVTELLITIRNRIKALSAEPEIKSVTVFFNRGSGAGISLHHPHGQIVSLPIIPGSINRRMEFLDEHWDNRAKCLVCEYIQRELESGLRVISKTNGFLICHPYASKTPYETWIMPVDHLSRFEIFDDDVCERFALTLRNAISLLQKNLSPLNYNINFIDGSNFLDPKNRFHFFARIFPRFNHIAGFELGTGMFINTHSPEQTALTIRESMS